MAAEGQGEGGPATAVLIIVENGRYAMLTTKRRRQHFGLFVAFGLTPMHRVERRQAGRITGCLRLAGRGRASSALRLLRVRGSESLTMKQRESRRCLSSAMTGCEGGRAVSESGLAKGHGSETDGLPPRVGRLPTVCCSLTTKGHSRQRLFRCQAQMRLIGHCGRQVGRCR